MSYSKIFSWCLFDFGTTVFMMNIISLSYVKWLEQECGCHDVYYGIISMGVYMLCLFLYPLTGPICDRGWKIFPLFILTTISIVAVAGLGFCHSLFWGTLLFFLAYLPYQMALTFYNSLLEDISTPKHMGIISGIGIALRYVGAIFGLISISFFIQSTHAVSLGLFTIQLPECLHFLILRPVAPGEVLFVNAFVPTALIYTVCVIPLFLFIRPTTRVSSKISLSLKEIVQSFRIAIQNKNVRNLLTSIFLSGIPVYAAVHFMAVFLENIGGFQKSELNNFLIIATLFSIVGGLGFGLLLRPWGNKKTFYTLILIWILGALLGSFAFNRPMVWVLGALCGLGMGGYWATSRVILLDVSPKGQNGVYLSIYWFVVVACAIVGTGLWALCVYIAEQIQFPAVPQRLSLFVLSIFGIASLLTFSRVQFEKH